MSGMFRAQGSTPLRFVRPMTKATFSPMSATQIGKMLTRSTLLIESTSLSGHRKSAHLVRFARGYPMRYEGGLCRLSGTSDPCAPGKHALLLAIALFLCCTLTWARPAQGPDLAELSSQGKA